MIKLKHFIRMTPSINYRYVGGVATFCICITTLPFLTSCANLPANYNDPNDFCSNERQGLAAHTEYFAQDVVKGAVGGAILGAITGATTAIVSGDKEVGKRALEGGVGGAVAGGILGYYKALQSQQGQLPDNFFTQLITDVDEENRRVEAMNNSFDQLVSCRKNQVANIRATYKRSEIDRSTGEKNMADLRQRVQDDLIVANSIRNGLGDRADKLQYVVNRATSDNQEEGDAGYQEEDDTGYQYSNLLDEYYAASDLDEFGGQLQYVGRKKGHSRNSKIYKRSHKGYKNRKAMKNRRFKHNRNKNKNKSKSKSKSNNSFKTRLAQSHDVFQNQHQHCENNFNELTKLKTASLDEGLEQSTSIFDYTNKIVEYALNQVLKYV